MAAVFAIGNSAIQQIENLRCAAWHVAAAGRRLASVQAANDAKPAALAGQSLETLKTQADFWVGSER